MIIWDYFQNRKLEKEKKQRWEKIEMSRVKNFEKELEELREIPEDSKEIFDFAVIFFNIVARFEDNGFLTCAPADKEETQKRLNLHICRAGRDRYGYNRTRKGEIVTLDNLYFGNIFGLVTLTARQWKNTNSLYYNFRGKESIPDRDVIANYQLYPLLSSHIDKMRQLCKELTT